MRREIAAALALLAGSGFPAQAIDASYFGAGATCVAGDCQSGTGTVQTYDGNRLTGPFAQGLPLPGASYTKEYAIRPGQGFPLRLGADRLPVEGTIPRDAATLYTGTLKRVENPFTGQSVTSYDTGRYEDDIGRVYEGQFEYVPVPFAPEGVDSANALRQQQSIASGIFLFSGARVTAAEDEVVRGIFATEASYPGMPLRFFRATPAFIQKVRRDFQTNQQRNAQLQEQARQQAAQEQASDSALLGTLFQVATGALLAAGQARLDFGANQLGLSQLSDVLTGRANPEQAILNLTSRLQDRQLNKLGLSIEDLTSLGSGNAPITTQQYAQTMIQTVAQAAVQGAAAKSGGASKTTPTGSSITQIVPANTVKATGGGAQVATKPSTAATAKAGADFDVLTDPPKITIAVTCTNETGVLHGSESIANGACRAASEKAKQVQCRSDWMMHPATLAEYACAEQNSTGAYKTKYAASRQWVESNMRNARSR
ncbi:MAG: hypothetical protein AB7G62_02940 [Magnetospirillum sp.]